MAYTGFDQLKAKLAAKGVQNPAGLAANIGRAKYGKEKFQNAAENGKSLENAQPIQKSMDHNPEMAMNNLGMPGMPMVAQMPQLPNQSGAMASPQMGAGPMAGPQTYNPLMRKYAAIHAAMRRKI